MVFPSLVLSHPRNVSEKFSSRQVSVFPCLRLCADAICVCLFGSRDKAQVVTVSLSLLSLARRYAVRPCLSVVVFHWGAFFDPVRFLDSVGTRALSSARAFDPFWTLDGKVFGFLLLCRFCFPRLLLFAEDGR